MASRCSSPRICRRCSAGLPAGMSIFLLVLERDSPMTDFASRYCTNVDVEPPVRAALAHRATVDIEHQRVSRWNRGQQQSGHGGSSLSNRHEQRGRSPPTPLARFRGDRTGKRRAPPWSPACPRAERTALQPRQFHHALPFLFLLFLYRCPRCWSGGGRSSSTPLTSEKRRQTGLRQRHRSLDVSKGVFVHLERPPVGTFLPLLVPPSARWPAIPRQCASNVLSMDSTDTGS